MLRHLQWLFLCLLVLGMAGCLSTGPRTLHFSTQQIQQKLNTRLAQPLTVMKVFQVQLSNAVVALETSGNRLHMVFDATVSGPMLSRPLAGQLDVAGELKYDAQKQAVILDQATLETVNINGLDATLNHLLQGLGRQLSSQWLNALVLYQVKPEELKLGGTHYVPSSIQLQADGVYVTLTPQP